MSATTVSVSPASPTQSPRLPSAIATNWLITLATVVLSDVSLGLFGARRHVFASYTMMYRLDVGNNTLRRVAFNEVHGYSVNPNDPTFQEVLASANVWVTYKSEPVAKKATAPIAKAVRKSIATRNTLAVSFTKKSVEEERLPSDLLSQWRYTFTTLVLSDLEKGLFGPRRHELADGRVLTYRLDVATDILKRVATAPRWTFDQDDDTPTLNDVLGCSKVWLSFNESAAPSAQKIEAPAPVVQAAPQTRPASPTLSDTTVVDDGCSTCAEVDKDDFASDNESEEKRVPITPEYAEQQRLLWNATRPRMRRGPSDMLAALTAHVKASAKERKYHWGYPQAFEDWAMGYEPASLPKIRRGRC